MHRQLLRIYVLMSSVVIISSLLSTGKFGFRSSSVTRQMSTLSEKISEYGFSSVNDRLVADTDDKASPFVPRTVMNAHYVNVKPEPCSKPYLIAASLSCMDALNLPHQIDQEFVDIFSGNKLVPGLDSPYCTNYGCHSYGQWFGQLGDGRAMALGEILNERSGESYELQLKGCGRSPFSRGFDGRAVLRSSIREFLASEAMWHLNVSTTRALSLLGTGDPVTRPWYDSTSTSTQPEEAARRHVSKKYPPNILKTEPGAIVCRVSRSFLRFGHLELLAIRKETKELIMLADFACFREFPDLLNLPVPDRYVELYRRIAKANAELVVDWLRVGYVQGNMNSDNTCLAGRTIDYGPFGFLEAFDPRYQPFTSDPSGNFCYIEQPTAMEVNVNILGEKAFVELIRTSLKSINIHSKDEDANVYIEMMYKIAKTEFATYFWNAYTLMKNNKLGVKTYAESNEGDRMWWNSLEALMYQSKSDFTIFFRELIKVSDGLNVLEAYTIVSSSFNEASVSDEVEGKWMVWLKKYLDRLENEKNLWASPDDRLLSMQMSNPKYILRNWMAIMAYEEAEAGDASVVEELLKLLADPYALREDAAGMEANKKWYQKTPEWARNMPGCTFMSCSS